MSWVLLYIMFTESPISKTDFLIKINKSDKNKMLKSLNFRNNITNYKIILNKDKKIVDKLFDNSVSISNLYKDDRVSLILFYIYYKKYPEKLKGRISKKEYKKISLLLEFFFEGFKQELENYSQELKWL
jgi:hypothetical protein